MPVEVSTGPAPRSPEEVVSAIEQALQDEELIITRETDLEAVKQYLETQTQGILHVVVSEDGEEVSSDIGTTYGRTKMGEYVIRFHSEGLEEVMTNGKTFLLEDDDGPGTEVFFSHARELFFGDLKAFVVCTPMKENG